jgi:adenylate kinase family enzyme
MGLAAKYGLKHISIVKMMEEHIHKKTELGRAAKYLISKGELSKPLTLSS